jgi:hypothetical protein
MDSVDAKVAKCPVRVSREELHRLVWERPMVQFAAEYGITGKGLAKICHHFEIPYPPPRLPGKKRTVDGINWE